MALPPLHPMIVHFPIALFVIGVLFDFFTAVRIRKSDGTRDQVQNAIQQFGPAAQWLHALGFTGSLVAVASGEWLKLGRSRVLPHGLLELHQASAIAFTVGYGLLIAFRFRRRWRPNTGYLTYGVCCFLLLVAVGHTGGSMAWPSFIRPVHTQTAISNQGAKHANGSQAKQPPAKPASGHGEVAAGHTGSGPAANSSTQTSSGSSTNKVLYQLGSNGTGVSQVQQWLSRLGYFQHAVTTYYGSVTASSVTAFQRDHGLSPTGQVDGLTFSKLQSLAGRSGSSGSGSTPATTNGSGGQSGGATTNRQSVGGGGSTTQHTGIDQVLYNQGYQLFVGYCQSCHSLGTAQQYYGQLSTAQWTDIVNRMQSKAGGTIPSTNTIVYYLSHHP